MFSDKKKVIIIASIIVIIAIVALVAFIVLSTDNSDDDVEQNVISNTTSEQQNTNNNDNQNLFPSFVAENTVAIPDNQIEQVPDLNDTVEENIEQTQPYDSNRKVATSPLTDLDPQRLIDATNQFADAYFAPENLVQKKTTVPELIDVDYVSDPYKDSLLYLDYATDFQMSRFWEPNDQNYLYHTEPKVVHNYSGGGETSVGIAFTRGHTMVYDSPDSEGYIPKIIAYYHIFFNDDYKIYNLTCYDTVTERL